VEIHWAKTNSTPQAVGEKQLASLLDQIQLNPGWFWMIPVGLGLGLLGFLATLNMGSAFWVFRGQ
jgi:hypothetical protein